MKPADQHRIESDSLGEVFVPKDAYYGAQTQRAVDNFPVSGIPLPGAFIHALGLIKGCACKVNGSLGKLEQDMVDAISKASKEVFRGKHDNQFPVDVFQTGSGTSTNMNANEVIAHIASLHLGRKVHPNDHVNCSQSSNDVIPTAIHVSAMLQIEQHLLPSLTQLVTLLASRSQELNSIVKTGRTHLMDAMPVSMGQELSAWKQQIESAIERLESVKPRLSRLAQGGTAVGTGINSDPQFAQRFAQEISAQTGIAFLPAKNKFEALSCQDSAVELSGQLRVLAVSLMKIANDLRWMNSGPLTGLSEISLPVLQPGSSIMPGKVNPVVPESVAMVCAQVIGNDSTITIAGQSGSFQLNVMLPVIALNLIQSIGLLTNAAQVLGEKAIAGFTVNQDRISQSLARNPILVTALNETIGYETAAKIAKKAYKENKAVLEVALEMTDLPESQLRELLDPAQLIEPR